MRVTFKEFHPRYVSFRFVISFVADTLTNPSVGPWVRTLVYYLLLSGFVYVMTKREMSLDIESVRIRDRKYDDQYSCFSDEKA